MAADNKQNGHLRKRQNKDKEKSTSKKEDVVKDVLEKDIDTDDNRNKKTNVEPVKRKISDLSNNSDYEHFDNPPFTHKISLAVVWLLSLATRLYKIDQPPLIWQVYI